MAHCMPIVIQTVPLVFPACFPACMQTDTWSIWDDHEGEVAMYALRILALAAFTAVSALAVTACTSTGNQRPSDLPPNTACALGFNTERPCSY